MGRETKIPWCHHTFNGVRGCEHATLADGTESPGCKHCYAENMSKRNPGLLGVWGSEGTRVLGKPNYWAQLDHWHADAGAAGELRRVFCYSLGDVFESPRSVANADVCAKGRALLFAAIERLRPVRRWPDDEYRIGLIFLLLTKRPENVQRMVPPAWLERWPQHVWLGTSVENQQAADERIPHLLAVPGVPVRFLSLEPLLERVSLRRWFLQRACDRCSQGVMDQENDHLYGRCRCVCHPKPEIDWLIPGGEGLGKRPCDLAWIRDIRDQGKAAGVPVFVKQMGSNPTDGMYAPRPDRPLITVSRVLRLKHPKGEDPEEWPEDLGVREMPSAL